MHTSVLFNRIKTNCDDTIGGVMHVVSDKNKAIFVVLTCTFDSIYTLWTQLVSVGILYLDKYLEWGLFKGSIIYNVKLGLRCKIYFSPGSERKTLY